MRIVGAGESGIRIHGQINGVINTDNAVGRQPDAVHVHCLRGCQRHTLANIQRGGDVAISQIQVHSRCRAIERGDIRIRIQGHDVVTGAAGNGHTFNGAINIQVCVQGAITEAGIQTGLGIVCARDRSVTVDGDIQAMACSTGAQQTHTLDNHDVSARVHIGCKGNGGIDVAGTQIHVHRRGVAIHRGGITVDAEVNDVITSTGGGHIQTLNVTAKVHIRGQGAITQLQINGRRRGVCRRDIAADIQGQVIITRASGQTDTLDATGNIYIRSNRTLAQLQIDCCIAVCRSDVAIHYEGDVVITAGGVDIQTLNITIYLDACHHATAEQIPTDSRHRGRGWGADYRARSHHQVDEVGSTVIADYLQPFDIATEDKVGRIHRRTQRACTHIQLDCRSSAIHGAGAASGGQAHIINTVISTHLQASNRALQVGCQTAGAIVEFDVNVPGTQCAGIAGQNQTVGTQAGVDNDITTAITQINRQLVIAVPGVHRHGANQALGVQVENIVAVAYINVEVLDKTLIRQRHNIVEVLAYSGERLVGVEIQVQGFNGAEPDSIVKRAARIADGHGVIDDIVGFGFRRHIIVIHSDRGNKFLAQFYQHRQIETSVILDSLDIHVGDAAISHGHARAIRHRRGEAHRALIQAEGNQSLHIAIIEFWRGAQGMGRVNRGKIGLPVICRQVYAALEQICTRHITGHPVQRNGG